MRVYLDALIPITILFASCNAQILNLVGDVVDGVVEGVVPLLVGQQPDNDNGTDSMNEYYALHDESNEDIGTYTMQQIIVRSGFTYKNHYVTSEDGYITQIIELIDPLADPCKLKGAPVMLFHGGLIDPTFYVWASAIQHHPEKYPRTAADGPITSSNRSLAFVLVNNGYQVYLVGTRGCDFQNQDHVKYKGPKQFDLSGETQAEPSLEALAEAEKYWNFSMDPIIKYEIPKQMDKVLELSGASNVTLFCYSLSTMTVPPFVDRNPDYAAKVHNMVVMAPIINTIGGNAFISILHDLAVTTPVEAGTLVFSELLLTQYTRDLLLGINANRFLRYTVVKAFFSLLLGPSAKYHTLLEPGVVGHILEPLSFKVAKHYSQQVLRARLQMYDYGTVGNELTYGQAEPPEYSISNLNVEHWLLISSTNDNLATPASVEQYVSQTNPKPYQHIVYNNSNHIDFVAAFQNDINIILPILAFLDRFHYNR